MRMHRRSCLAALSLFATAFVMGCSPSEREEDCVAEGNSALKVCSTAPSTLKGIDVSYWQGTIAWPNVKASGVAYAFARVSYGKNTVDTKFATNWSEMKAEGLVRGAYQYFLPSQDPLLQADLLVSKLTAAGYTDADLPPVLDLEQTDGLAPSAVAANAVAWIKAVEKGLGRRPIVYSAAFMSSVTALAGLPSYPLWVANYDTSCPTMPNGFTKWSFWQYTSKGSVAGIGGNVDVNHFNGTLADLLAFNAASKLGGTTDPGTSTTGTAAPGAVVGSIPYSFAESDPGDRGMGSAGTYASEVPTPNEAPAPCL